MSDVPRTDAAFESKQIGGTGAYGQMHRLAEQLERELAAMQAERDALKQGKQLYADELNKLCQQSKQMILEKGNLVDRVATLETACRAILPFVEEDLDGMETYATGAYKAAIEQLQAALGKDGG